MSLHRSKQWWKNITSYYHPVNMPLQHMPLISNVSRWTSPRAAATPSCKQSLDYKTSWQFGILYILLYIYRDIRLRLIYLVCSRNTSCREAPKINKYVKQKTKIVTGFVVKRPMPSKCFQWSTLSHYSPIEQHQVPSPKNNHHHNKN